MISFAARGGKSETIVVTNTAAGRVGLVMLRPLSGPDNRARGSPASTCNANAFLDAQTLDANGTWTVLVDPQGSAAGHLTLQAYAVTDQAAAIVRNGVAVPVTTTTPGQNARFTLSIAAGQQISAYLSN